MSLNNKRLRGLISWLTKSCRMNIIESKALMERVGDNELYREPMGVEIRWVVVFEVRFGAAGVKF